MEKSVKEETKSDSDDDVFYEANQEKQGPSDFEQDNFYNTGINSQEIVDQILERAMNFR